MILHDCRWIVLWLLLVIQCNPDQFFPAKCPDYSFSRPVPAVFPDNCINTVKIQLGRFLFYEKKLSKNQTQSCSSCHVQKNGFAENRSRAIGSTAMVHPRNTPGLANVAYFKALTWNNPGLNRLQNQAINPLLSMDGKESIVELGVARMEDVVAQRLFDDNKYPPLFKQAFGSEEINIPKITKALEAFQLTLHSFQSPYDRGVMSQAAKRGETVFWDKKCDRCHSGINFNQPLEYKSIYDLYRNIGLYNINGKGDYPDYNLHGKPAQKMTQGLYATTKNPEDRGKFRIPSLRNLRYTAPYMHDGSMKTLEEVIEHFSQGGRNITSGTFRGDGRNSSVKDPAIIPIKLTSPEKTDLLAFLLSLSDECFITNPEYSDPLKEAPVQETYCKTEQL